ncbi:hypothetical protein KXV85_006519 [Aspergillus fumigatus]|nr:hypothetical protein KXV85_006519 [Aspergillus fumigatus]
MDTPMLVRGNWSKARIFQPILRAYAIGYLSSTTPRVISYLRRLKDDRLSNKEKLEELIYFNLAARYPKITKDKLTFVAQLSRTLTNVIRLDSFPTFCALLVAGSTVLPVLLLRLCALVSSRIGKISGPVKSRVFLRFVRFVAAFVSAWFSFQLLNKKPIRQQGSDVISSHKTGSGANAGHSPEKKITPQYSPDLAGRTMGLTLFTFTRAMDALVCLGWSRWRASRRGQNRWSLVETVAPVLADTGLFAASSAVVMWAWFYLPERLPRSYGKWIGEVAKVDIRLIEALRRARRGIFVYGKETGQARLLESMCEDYNWPREWGDPSKTIPIPCEMVHMGCGPNCEKHAVWRFAKTFKFACATYIPLQVVFRVRSMKTMSSLWRALADSLRSSTFLASFVSIFYYSVCLARTRIGPKIFSRETVTPQMWDSGLCVGAGCLMCGWSILVESARKRQEIALFVAPRAAATVLPRYYDKKTSGEWTTRLDELAERVIFLDSSRLDAREPTKLSDGTYSADDLCLDQCVSEDYEGPLDEDVDCVRRIPIDLRDEKCLHLVRGWTAECTARSTCSKTLAVKLPETIIEIPADPAVAPKLCSSNGRSGSYVILSYCSGDFEPSSQRESGNTGFSAPLDGPSLPKTLADAIEIARKLGYQYLWTRTLCTSREEWGSDPARIAALYGQAALMLSAEAAKDPDSGIFHDRRVFYSPALGRNKDKYLRQQLLRWTTDIEESATAGRGSGQIRRCYVKGAVQPYIDRFLQDRVEEAGGVGGEVDVSKRVARLEAWHRCVDAFSKKSVDVTSDKLLVMAPLASAINDGTLGEYLAGIWSSDIAFGLGRLNTRYFDFGKKFFSHNSFLRQELHQNSAFAPFNTPQSQKRNASVMYYTASIVVGTLALAYGSVPLYKMVCQQIGWNGQPVLTHRTGDGDTSSRVTPVTDARRLRITFNGSVSDVLPWKFTPQQREVCVLPGETALAFYTATNKGPTDIIGVATYSVTPGQVAPYFSKIQCFCFEEQKLNAGESVDMPVFFFIDPDFVKDPAMKGIDTITLSYTFFKAKYDDNGVLKPIPAA